MKLFISIMGWAWILLGLWWFFRPAGIQKRFAKKYRKTVRWILLVVFFALAGAIYSAGKGLGGWSGTFLTVLSIILLVKGLFFMRGKMSDQFSTDGSFSPTRSIALSQRSCSFSVA